MIGTIITIASIAIIGIILWLFARIHHWTGRALRAERQLDHPEKPIVDQHADALAIIEEAGSMPLVEKFFDKMDRFNQVQADLRFTGDLLARSNGQSGPLLRAGQVISRLNRSEYRAAMDAYKERQYRVRAEAAEAKLAKLAKEGQGS